MSVDVAGADTGCMTSTVSRALSQAVQTAVQNAQNAIQKTAAEPKKPEPVNDRATFRELDRNADGQLSRLEVGVGGLRAGEGLVGAFRGKDRFDVNSDRSTSFREFAGTQAAQRMGSQIGPPASLAGRLDTALPREATLTPQLRERVLDRANRFEADAREMARTQSDPNSPLGQLRGQLGERFAPNADIALHGVASHMAPETLQARVRDRQGQEHTFVRDGQGRWVERPDLQGLHAAGRTPSLAPGMQTSPNSTATFGVATVRANGAVDVQVPDVSNFSHQPRTNPLRVGDTVQVVEATGQARAATAGQPYQSPDRVAFGRIAGTDGRGNWTVEMTNADGSVQRGADGRPVTRQLTDEQLRVANNPTVVRDGEKIYDATVDRRHPAQRSMIAAFDATPAAQELERTRPGPNASPQERAAWERRAIEAADNFLDARMRYPMSAEATAALRAEVNGMQNPPPELVQRVEAAERYQRMERDGANIGEYLENGLGQCRHQAIGMQVMMQHLGIDARLTRGAANTAEGNYRGEHMWIEATLADGSHMLVDPTWTSTGGERPGPLEAPYRNDRRREEAPGMTIDDYRRHFANVPQPRRIDADEVQRRSVIT